MCQILAHLDRGFFFFCGLAYDAISLYVDAGLQQSLAVLVTYQMDAVIRTL